jgi:hypothetical protein
MKNFLTFLFISLPCFCFAQEGSLRIVVESVFDQSPLQLEDKAYVNAHGDSLYIDEFKFYLSNLRFHNHDRIWGEQESYHLVDASEKGTQTFVIKNIPVGAYYNLTLMIGVDSMANVSGANGGDLDPVKGMYWAWNTGYIMTKLQGRSKACKTLHHAFEFHIGGYLPPYNAARAVQLYTPGLKIEAGKESVLHLKANAAEWFKNPETVDLAKMNEVNMPCKDAMRVADNYADMLSAY